jgi:hypothetical protein
MCRLYRECNVEVEGARIDRYGWHMCVQGVKCVFMAMMWGAGLLAADHSGTATLSPARCVGISGAGWLRMGGEPFLHSCNVDAYN